MKLPAALERQRQHPLAEVEAVVVEVEEFELLLDTSCVGCVG